MVKEMLANTFGNFPGALPVAAISRIIGMFNRSSESVRFRVRERMSQEKHDFARQKGQL